MTRREAESSVMSTELPVWTYVELPEEVYFERIMGPMFGLRYPSRRTPDLYLMGLVEGVVHCCQDKCSARDFGYEELTAHLEEHAPRQDRRLFR